MKFLQRTILTPAPVDENAIVQSMKGISKMITKYKQDAIRSRNPDYVIKREEKIDKLKLIYQDLRQLTKSV
jgi:hypothetical protein